MADYDPTQNLNQRGWMQMFPEFLTGDESVKNGGINGMSSKSFYVNGAWNMVKAALNAGDYVFIQFAHNDEKDDGVEGPGGIGTAAFGAYNDSMASGGRSCAFPPLIRRS
jgi:lysophospholipase L1-like esterase